MSEVSIPVFTLCDTASVREGLLHILGAGITVLQRNGEFPAQLGATVAALATFTGESPAPPRLTFRITTIDGAPIGIDDLVVGPESTEAVEVAEFESGPIYTIPIIIDVRELELPLAGRYKLTLSGPNGEPHAEFVFDTA